MLGNLETPLIDEELPASVGRLAPLKTSQKMIEAIVNASFDVVSLGNNHMIDYGPIGLLRTLEVLDRNKILHAGAGRNKDEALRPVIIEKNNLKIGFLSYEATTYSFGAKAKKEWPGLATITVNPLLPYPQVAKEDIIEMSQQIKDVKSVVDILVFSMHCGAELTTTLSPHQEYIAHAAVDSGADIVVGHHPHILQGIEIYKEKVICYSLGNFIFDREFFPSGEATIVLKANISSNKKIGISLIPVFDDGGILKLLDKSESLYKETLQNMGIISQNLGTKIDETTGKLII